MKKRIVLASVLIVAIGSLGGALALSKQQPIKVHHVAVTLAPTPEPTSTASTQADSPATTTEPVVPATDTPPAETTPTPEENAAKFKTYIQSVAKSRIDSENFIWRQWYCLDQQVTSSVGYSNYEDALAVPFVYAFLTPRPNANGDLSVLQFGEGAPGVCGHSIRPISSY